MELLCFDRENIAYLEEINIFFNVDKKDNND